jgi:glutaminyl-tRNA synthetase
VLNRIVPLKDTWAKVQARVSRARAGAEAAPPPAAADAAPEPVRTVRELTPVGVALRDAGLSDDQAAVLQADEPLRAWYEAALAGGGSPASVAGWVVTELPRIARERGGLAGLGFDAASLGELAAMVERGEITGAVGKQVLQHLAESGGDPAAIVAEQGWSPITDAASLDAVVQEVVGGFPDRVAAYRGGRTGLLGFFVGQVMQRTDGRADPQQVRASLQRALG